MAIDEHRINGIPTAMYYIPNFLTEAEEQFILNKIPTNRWTTLAHRRLQAVPTHLTANNTLLASSLPEWLANPAVPRIESLGVFQGSPHGINHCLVNEYLPGQGIMPHEDGAAYHPVVATISLGSTLVLDVSAKPRLDQTTPDHGGLLGMSRADKGPWQIVQEPRSLLVTTGVAYAETLHGIAEVTEDIELSAQTVANWTLLGNPNVIEVAGGRNERSKRISLTFRDVERVSKLGSKLFGKRGL